MENTGVASEGGGRERYPGRQVRQCSTEADELLSNMAGMSRKVNTKNWTLDLELHTSLVTSIKAVLVVPKFRGIWANKTLFWVVVVIKKKKKKAEK